AAAATLPAAAAVASSPDGGGARGGARGEQRRLGASSRGSGCDVGEIRPRRSRRRTTEMIEMEKEEEEEEREGNMKKERSWIVAVRVLWRLVVRAVKIGVHTVAVSLFVLIVASGTVGLPRTTVIPTVRCRNQQLAVLAALGSVSLVAIYVWYQKKQDKAKKMARAAAAQQAAAATVAATSTANGTAAKVGRL
ncbi:hypothetical protein PFISCL1PPCAC_9847, partial [Pristionchus fissidentatus]